MDRSLSFLGVPLDACTLTESMELLNEMIQSRGFHHVVTANVDFLVHARRSADFRRVLSRADLILPDGMPLVWLLRGLGQRAERVTGADLVPAISALAEQRGYQIFLLGTHPDVSAAAAWHLQQRHPKLRPVAVFSPPFSATFDNEAILRRIEAVHPDVLMVALGCPKQEVWINLHRGRLNVPLCIGIGGTLDFVSGFRRRAPLWMQSRGLEWLFRLGLEPRRLWRRYWNDWVQLMSALLLTWLNHHRSRHGASGHLVRKQQAEALVVEVHGVLQRPMVEELSQLISDPSPPYPHLHIDLSLLRAIDSRDAATVVRLAGRSGERVSWQHPRGWLADWLGLSSPRDLTGPSSVRTSTGPGSQFP